jgi:hypothetical protein
MNQPQPWAPSGLTPTIHSFSRNPEEHHRIYEDPVAFGKASRYFILDSSGDTPQSCEDGPLEVVPGQVVDVGYFSGVVGAVRVWSHRSEEWNRVWVDLPVLRRLKSMVSMTLLPNQDFKKRATDVQEVILMMLE